MKYMTICGKISSRARTPLYTFLSEALHTLCINCIEKENGWIYNNLSLGSKILKIFNGFTKFDQMRNIKY